MAAWYTVLAERKSINLSADSIFLVSYITSEKTHQANIISLEYASFRFFCLLEKKRKRKTDIKGKDAKMEDKKNEKNQD